MKVVNLQTINAQPADEVTTGSRNLLSLASPSPAGPSGAGLWGWSLSPKPEQSAWPSSREGNWGPGKAIQNTLSLVSQSHCHPRHCPFACRKPNTYPQLKV